MISPTIKTDYVNRITGQPIVASNQCAHCGESDDPQDTRHWETDGDGDKMCFPCAEVYEILLDQSRKELKSEESFIALKTNHEEDLAVFARAAELWKENSVDS